MADPVSIAIAAAAAATEYASVESEKATLEGQARVSEARGAVAEREAGMREEALRGQQERQLSELSASAVQEGLADSVTFTDAFRQSAVKAELDALMMGYSGPAAGAMARQEAKQIRAAKPTGAQRLLRVGTAAFMGFKAGGGSFGGGGAGASGASPASWSLSG